MTKPKALKTSYAAAGEQTIHAYSDEAWTLKTAFLSDSRALLKAAASQCSGWKSEVRINKAGVAVGGEVYLDLKKPNCAKALHVCLAGSVISGRVADRIYMIAQIRSNDDRRSILAGNFEIDPNLNADELAKKFRLLLDKCEK